MATLVPDVIPSSEDLQPCGTAELAIVTTPIRAADGSLRTLRQPLPLPCTVADALPDGLTVARLIHHGRVLTPDDEALPLQAGDELLLLPTWGDPVFTPTLLTFAIGLAVSVAATALSYLIFPPQRPKLQAPDDPTFGFEGIRTAYGPGAVVPAIYGRHRIGGQLLAAAIVQSQTIEDIGQPQRSIQALAAPPTLTMLLALGEGQIEEVILSSIEINNQPIANFPGTQIDWRAGTPDQAALPAFGESANTFADGRVIPQDGTGITYTTHGPIDAFVINIVFNQGLYHFTSQGNKEDNAVTIRYWYQIHPSGGWAGPLDWDVVAARTAPVRLGIRRQMPGQALFDIRVELVAVKNTNESRDHWEPTLESVTEIQHNTQTYPHTALLGIKAVATDALQGALPNITTEVRGRRVRVGTFNESSRAWSDNPAWCVMDLLTNTRFGLGIPDAEIDLAAFTAWAAWNESIIEGERRHVLNYVLDRDVRAQSALMEILGGSRTLLFKSQGFWTPRPTRPDPPVQLLSWANVTDLKVTYTRDVDRVNVLEVRFSNEDQAFQQDTLTWPTLANWPAEVRKAGLELRGVTKPSRVMRAAQFELNRRRFETFAIDFTASLEAIVLQPHDLFRFSHPLPGWGQSGRMGVGSTTTTLHLDTPVHFVGAQSYLVYVRHDNDVVEMKPVAYPGDVETTTLTLLSPLLAPPAPRTSTWAFGFQVGATDSATRTFRVVTIARVSANRVQIQAIVHNASIYDEPEGEPLPVITDLFNPLGPPPPLTSLIAREVTRVQASGASMRVVNLSWDVAALSRGLAPYGGAKILRRTVLASSGAGQAGAGAEGFGQLQGPNDGQGNFLPVTQVSGHVLDFDDFTVLTDITYVYRVVPVSGRGVPNENGAREVLIHVAGPTTPDFFPATPLNLRLKGKRPGETEFEGRDIQIEWDAPTDNALFSETFFLTDYLVQFWTPGQVMLLRQVIVPAGARGVSLGWTYTQEQNAEDHVRNGLGGAGRTILILVWCRTNTGRISLDPARLQVTNPPPDMSDLMPTVLPLFEAALISWDQYFPPRDFDHFLVYLDTSTPPLAIYGGVDVAFQKIAPVGLIAGATYYVYILPFDTFGPGARSQIASFVPVSFDDSLDDVPPAVPSGLVLTTGTSVSADGTIVTWVQAAWATNTESDLAGYEVHFRVAPSTVPTVFSIDKSQHSVRLENVGGGVTVFARLLAFDKLHNVSLFTEEVSIVTGTDSAPPGLPQNAQAYGTFKAIALLWTPPADLDYAVTEVWASVVNDRTTAVMPGEAANYFLLGNLGSEQTWYFWLRARDTSGNVSAFVPPTLTSTLSATTAQTSSADIGNLSITETKISDNAISTPKLQANSVDANKVTTGELITLGAQIRDAVIDNAHIANIRAEKILTSTLQALVGIGAGGRVYLDGVHDQIVIYDNQPAPAVRVILGKLGTLTQQYGLQLFNELGQTMWNFATGATPEGIQDSAITAQKIAAGVITAGHVRADTALITNAIQIASAVINDAHIQEVAAEKLRAGTIHATIGIGVGNQLQLRGPLGDLLVVDTQSTPQVRVLLGNLSAVGVSDYGLFIWNAAGQLMWNFASGATNAGISDNAVNTPKIQPVAVTEALQFSAGGPYTIENTLLTAGTVTFPSLDAGDQVWFVGKATTSLTNPAYIADLRLNLGSQAGAILDQTTATGFGQVTLMLQTVYTVPAPVTNQSFAFSFVGGGGPDPIGALQHVHLVAFRRRR